MDKRLEHIEGLTTGKPAYDGVIITHNHQDHMGRTDEVLPEIPLPLQVSQPVNSFKYFIIISNKNNYYKIKKLAKMPAFLNFL